MNVYLACTVRGDRSALSSTRAVAATIREMGHTILTSHLLDDDVESAESQVSERAVFERDLDWLARADVLIAEASGSSFGVGFELGYFLGGADGSRRRALLLYDRERRNTVSRLVVGNSHPRCATHAYESPADLRQRIVDFLNAPSH